MSEERSQVSVNDEYIEKYGFHETENYTFKSEKGLDESVVRNLSKMKGEPEWMLDFRLRSLEAFYAKPMPNWGSEVLQQIDFDDIYYYIKPTDGQSKTWEDLPAEIKNTYDRLGIPEAEKKYLAGVGAQYECLHEDSLVFTARGAVPIKDIQTGDIVFAFDEAQDKLIPAPVKGKAFKGDKNVFEVKVGTRKIRATENHPFLTLTYVCDEGKQRGRYHREWKYLRDLRTGDLVAVAKQLPDVGQPKQLVQPEIKTHVRGKNQFGANYDLDISGRYNEVTLPDTTTENLMWCLGLFTGDGCIHRANPQDKARVEFAIPKKDEALRAELMTVTESVFGLAMTDPDGFRLTANSTVVARFIEANELDGTAHTKRVPKWVFGLPESQRLAFLGGYVDADGYVRDSAKAHDISVTSASQNLLEDIRALAMSCGITTSDIHQFESKHPIDKTRMMTGFRLQFSGDFDKVGCRSPQRTERMGKRNYFHNYTSAKGTHFKQHTNEFVGFAKIESIEAAGVAAVYDIEVDGPHNFVAEGLVVHNSEVIYHSLAKDLEEKGVIFTDTDSALRDYPELFREYFGTIIPYTDNKFAALNSAVWSGGSFIYVPKGVKIDMPLQAYFRINAKNVGQFERTLILVDEGAQVHYVEGCFLADARVRTPNGEKPIQDIQVGDQVLTHKGRFRNVYNTMARPYVGTIYNIKYFGDSRQTLRVTEEHPLLVVEREQLHNRNKDFSPKWMAASQVKLGDYLTIPLQRSSDELMTTLAAGSEFAFRADENFAAAPTSIQRRHSLIAMQDPASNQPFHMDENFMYVPIRSIEIEEMDTTVYNFSVEEDESYVCEGVVSHNCTAPVYSSDSLHSAVVEIVIKKGGRCRYTTIQNWSTNVYNLVTKRAAAYEDATMEWVDGNLGCLAEGSTVTTPEGIKTIESLNVGDKVLSYDDKTGEFVFRHVNAKKFSGQQKVHSVAVGERKLNVTSNHPFYSYAYDADVAKKLGRYQLAYVRADQLKQAIIPRTSLDYGLPHHLAMPMLTTAFDSGNQYADELSMSRERQSRLTVDTETTNELMWLFGYWVGDGNIEIKPAKTEGVIRWAKVGFSTPPADRARERLVNTMTAVMEAEPTERADGNHLYWSSKELAEFFALNGFSGNARTKRVPGWVWSLPETQRAAFIAGYLDADGTVIESKREFSLKSVNKNLLQDVASLLVTLGVTARLYTEFDEPKLVKIMGVEAMAHGSHRLVFGLDGRVCDHVSPQLQAKAAQCREPKLLHHRTVGRSNIELPESVEIVDVNVSELSAQAVPTWDIEVEGTGNFVSQGFIVHNSKLTMKYPAVYLMEKGAHGEILSIAFAGKGQHQDAGGKVVHAAPNTTSKIVSKSISKDGGRTSYRGLLKVYKDAENSKSNVVCDALLLDETSRSDTYPYIEVDNDSVNIGHEASVSKIGEEQLFYAMSRGVSEEDASTMVVSGFIEPLVKELPMEYAVEMNRLIALQMEGTVG